MSWLTALPLVGGLFDSIGNAVDKNVTNDEERLKLKSELASLYIPLLQSVVEAQKHANEMQVRLAEAEMKSEHWLVWARRPIISFLAIGNLILAGFLKHMDMDTAFYFAMLVNGLDSGTRGLEKIVTGLKGKEKV